MFEMEEILASLNYALLVSNIYHSRENLQSYGTNA